MKHVALNVASAELSGLIGGKALRSHGIKIRLKISSLQVVFHGLVLTETKPVDNPHLDWNVTPAK